MTHTTDAHTQGTPTSTEAINPIDLAMYQTGLEINRIDAAISKLQEEKAYNKAWIILLDASKTLIHNECMAKYNDGEVETELFYGGADFDYHMRNNRLSKHISQMARHFGDMDDSEAMPAWSNKAYKAAQTIQKYYNINLKNL